MMDQEELVFHFDKNLQNTLSSYKKLIELFHLCIWRILTAGFAEQNGRNAKLNGRITFDY